MPSSEMSRRDFLRAAGAAALAGGTAALGTGESIAARAQQTERPNIVVILADDLGYGDLPCYGNPHTIAPRLDQMAQEGVRFTDFYVTSPYCTPTRAGFLTGRQPERVGLNYLVMRGPTFTHGLDLKEITVADTLGEAGYTCGITGKWHVGFLEQFWPRKRGFHEFWGTLSGGCDYYEHIYKDGNKYVYRNEDRIDPEGYLTDLITHEALKFLRHHHNDEQPFFLYVPYTTVHTPWQVPERYEKLYEHLEVPDYMRRYYGMVTSLDESVGQILDQIEELGISDNTLVFFFSDNGGHHKIEGSNTPLRGHKGTMWEGGYREPAIARWPGVMPAGQVSTEMFTSLDLFPTFCELTGTPPPDVYQDGKSVWPLLNGSGPSPHEELYWCFRDQYNIRRGNWKLMCTQKDQYRLYDLEADIAETTDCYQQQPQIAAELKARLDHFEAHIHDDRPPEE